MNKTALVLTIIGALNWGLVGIFKFDFVAWIFGDRPLRSAGLSTPSSPLPDYGAFPCSSAAG
jgi:hypothetical protein